MWVDLSPLLVISSNMESSASRLLLWIVKALVEVSGTVMLAQPQGVDNSTSVWLVRCTSMLPSAAVALKLPSTESTRF